MLDFWTSGTAYGGVLTLALLCVESLQMEFVKLEVHRCVDDQAHAFLRCDNTASASYGLKIFHELNSPL